MRERKKGEGRKGEIKGESGGKGREGKEEAKKESQETLGGIFRKDLYPLHPLFLGLSRADRG